MNDSNFTLAVNPFPHSGELVVLFAGHERTKPAHTIPPQVLDYYLLHYICAGKGTYECKGKQYQLQAGDSFVIFPGELHSYKSDEQQPWEYRWVAWNGKLAMTHLANLSITPDQPAVHTSYNRRLPVLIHQIKQTLLQPSPSSTLHAEGLLRILFAEIMSAQTTQIQQPIVKDNTSPQLAQAIQWLSLRYSQQISIDALAQQMGYHRSHFSKIFKQHTGLSPLHFLTKVRMGRARILLLTTSLTIEQVASSVGFEDPLYFSKQFKKRYHLSPKQFREDHKGNEANPFRN